MKNRFVAFLAAVVTIAGLSVLGTASPASAHGACAAQGTVTVTAAGGGGLGVAVVNDRGFSFIINAQLSTCAGTVSASGSGYGGCGASSGSGTLTYNGHGHSFSFQTAASVIILSGGVTGSGNVVVDASTGGSCASKTATKFLVSASWTH